MAGGGKHTWRSTGVPPKRESTAGGELGVGGAGTGGGDACDIHFETILNSVDLPAVQGVSRGSKLDVEIVNENGVERLVTKLNGIFIGVISHPKTLDIIACIGAGNQYVAFVVEKQGNLCRVRIERRAI